MSTTAITSFIVYAILIIVILRIALYAIKVVINLLKIPLLIMANIASFLGLLLLLKYVFNKVLRPVWRMLVKGFIYIGKAIKWACRKIKNHYFTDYININKQVDLAELK